MRFNHVNLAVHPDVLEQEMTFLADGLGLARVDPGPEFRERARWYETPDGMQVHLSRTTETISTRPGHIALDVGEALDEIERRLVAVGLAPERQVGREPAVTLVTDHGGHLWELRVKAVQVVRNGAPVDVVEVRDVDAPTAGPGEVCVAVSAASVNFGDIARAKGGVATVQAQPPFTLGMDVCGIVESAGAGGEHLVGRRVVAMAKQSFGGIAEHAVCAVSGVFDAPEQLDDVTAAGFLLPFHTSYLALHRRAKLQAGEWVLVVGASSSVGTAAVQLAVAAGARVVAVTGSAEKGEYCRALGAVVSIDYRTEDLFDRTMAETDDHGADVLLDLVGGDLTETLWTCMAGEGRYLPVGFNGEATGGLAGKPLRKVSMGNFSVLGVMVSYSGAAGPLRKFGLNPFPPEVGREVHAALCDLIARGAVAPQVGRRITMDEVGAALDDHEHRRTSGRTVVDVAASR